MSSNSETPLSKRPKLASDVDLQESLTQRNYGSNTPLPNVNNDPTSNSVGNTSETETAATGAGSDAVQQQDQQQKLQNETIQKNKTLSQLLSSPLPQPTCCAASSLSNMHHLLDAKSKFKNTPSSTTSVLPTRSLSDASPAPVNRKRTSGVLDDSDMPLWDNSMSGYASSNGYYPNNRGIRHMSVMPESSLSGFNSNMFTNAVLQRPDANYLMHHGVMPHHRMPGMPMSAHEFPYRRAPPTNYYSTSASGGGMIRSHEFNQFSRFNCDRNMYLAANSQYPVNGLLPTNNAMPNGHCSLNSAETSGAYIRPPIDSMDKVLSGNSMPSTGISKTSDNILQDKSSNILYPDKAGNSLLKPPITSSKNLGLNNCTNLSNNTFEPQVSSAQTGVAGSRPLEGGELKTTPCSVIADNGYEEFKNLVESSDTAAVAQSNSNCIGEDLVGKHSDVTINVEQNSIGRPNSNSELNSQSSNKINDLIDCLSSKDSDSDKPVNSSIEGNIKTEECDKNNLQGLLSENTFQAVSTDLDALVTSRKCDLLNSDLSSCCTGASNMAGLSPEILLESDSGLSSASSVGSGGTSGCMASVEKEPRSVNDPLTSSSGEDTMETNRDLSEKEDNAENEKLDSEMIYTASSECSKHTELSNDSKCIVSSVTDTLSLSTACSDSTVCASAVVLNEGCSIDASATTTSSSSILSNHAEITHESSDMLIQKAASVDGKSLEASASENGTSEGEKVSEIFELNSVNSLTESRKTQETSGCDLLSQRSPTPVTSSDSITTPMSSPVTSAETSPSLSSLPAVSVTGGGDPEKPKMIQQQLVLLLHAHKCQRREQMQSGGDALSPAMSPVCQVPHCQTMKSVLKHMTECQDGKSCKVLHCASSRQIITHWKNCAKTDCPVCLPLKNASDKRGPGYQPMQPKQPLEGTGGEGAVTASSHLSMSLTFSDGRTVVSGAGGLEGTGPLGAANHADVMRTLGLNPEFGEKGTAEGSVNSGTGGVGGLDSAGCVATTVSSGVVQKDWHKSVTLDLRNHLVNKLVQAIFPMPDQNVLQDQRMNNLLQYAKKVEGDMFESANSREEYYHMLAEKIYKIQKELEEKRQKRLHEQQSMVRQAHPAGGELPPGGGVMGGEMCMDGGMRQHGGRRMMMGEGPPPPPYQSYHHQRDPHLIHPDMDVDLLINPPLNSLYQMSQAPGERVYGMPRHPSRMPFGHTGRMPYGPGVGEPGGGGMMYGMMGARGMGARGPMMSNTMISYSGGSMIQGAEGGASLNDVMMMNRQRMMMSSTAESQQRMQQHQMMSGTHGMNRMGVPMNSDMRFVPNSLSGGMPTGCSGAITTVSNDATLSGMDGGFNNTTNRLGASGDMFGSLNEPCSRNSDYTAGVQQNLTSEPSLSSLPAALQNGVTCAVCTVTTDSTQTASAISSKQYLQDALARRREQMEQQQQSMAQQQNVRPALNQLGLGMIRASTANQNLSSSYPRPHLLLSTAVTTQPFSSGVTTNILTSLSLPSSCNSATVLPPVTADWSVSSQSLTTSVESLNGSLNVSLSGVNRTTSLSDTTDLLSNTSTVCSVSADVTLSSSGSIVSSQSTLGSGVITPSVSFNSSSLNNEDSSDILAAISSSNKTEAASPGLSSITVVKDEVKMSLVNKMKTCSSMALSSSPAKQSHSSPIKNELSDSKSSAMTSCSVTLNPVKTPKRLNGMRKESNIATTIKSTSVLSGLLADGIVSPDEDAGSDDIKKDDGKGSNDFNDSKCSIKESSDLKLTIKTSQTECAENKEENSVGGGVQIKVEPMCVEEGEGVSVKSECVKQEPSEENETSEVKMEDAEDGDTTMDDTQKQAAWLSVEEIQIALLPLWEKIYSLEPEAAPFRVPVNPMLLGIPDYFNVIKFPMDLSTIKERLDAGLYIDPWMFIDDMWLMFNNAWIYNRKTSRVYKFCSKLAEIFESEIDEVMRSLGYCCGHKFMFSPQALWCFGKQLCAIPRDAVYYSYQDRYIYCEKCFLEMPQSELEINDDPSQPSIVIRKEQFVREKNDKLEYELLVTCVDCGRRLHAICALYMDVIWPEGFTCDNCLKLKNEKRKENKYISKRLPCSKLGTFLENRVNTMLQKRDVEHLAGEVTIRVLSSYDKIAEVKPGMKARFCTTGEMPDSFPYRIKTVFAFQEIDGAEVCLFGMHVQEYGSDCPQPNSRRVYIAYLDSVHYFHPRYLRTMVYHELLIGYLDYVKTLGFVWAHIWACPPSEGDDYIFHCHPPEQKIPKPKRLQEWYRRMLDKALNERIIIEYKDILRDAIDNNATSVTKLAYFEGDFWPNVMEDCIKELDQEQTSEKRIKRELPVSEPASNECVASSDATNTENVEAVEGKKKGQKSGKMNKKKSGNKSRSGGLSGGGGVQVVQKRSGGTSKFLLSQGCLSDLSNKLLSTMEKHKEVFFVIRLHTVGAAAVLGPIVDPDPLINNDLMDGRDAFLTLARDRHYEFSSLRRTKFSTLGMLYELHNQSRGDSFVYTCNNCRTNVETRYHCSTCDDFDLCVPCFERLGHPHPMEKLGLDIIDPDGAVAAIGDTSSLDETRSSDATSDTKASTASHAYLTKQSTSMSQATAASGMASTASADGPVDAAEAKRRSIQACITSLVHACHCHDEQCRLPTCHKMKRLVTHTRSCRRKNTGAGCAICKQLIALCCYHAKTCRENPVPASGVAGAQGGCPVPFCSSLKAKLAQAAAEQRFKQTQLVRRRMLAMKGASSSSSSNVSETSTTPRPNSSTGPSLSSSPAPKPAPQYPGAKSQPVQQQGANPAYMSPMYEADYQQGKGKGYPQGKGKGYQTGGKGKGCGEVATPPPSNRMMMVHYRPNGGAGGGSKTGSDVGSGEGFGGKGDGMYGGKGGAVYGGGKPSYPMQGMTGQPGMMYRTGKPMANRMAYPTVSKPGEGTGYGMGKPGSVYGMGSKPSSMYAMNPGMSSKPSMYSGGMQQGGVMCDGEVRGPRGLAIMNNVRMTALQRQQMQLRHQHLLQQRHMLQQRQYLMSRQQQLAAGGAMRQQFPGEAMYRPTSMHEQGYGNMDMMQQQQMQQMMQQKQLQEQRMAAQQKQQQTQQMQMQMQQELQQQQQLQQQLQQQQHMQQQQQMQHNRAGSVPRSDTSVESDRGRMSADDTSKATLQKILTSLKSNSSAHEKQEAVDLLKSNPQLMAGAIRQTHGMTANIPASPLSQQQQQQQQLQQQQQQQQQQISQQQLQRQQLRQQQLQNQQLQSHQSMDQQQMLLNQQRQQQIIQNQNQYQNQQLNQQQSQLQQQQQQQMLQQQQLLQQNKQLESQQQLLLCGTGQVGSSSMSSRPASASSEQTVRSASRLSDIQLMSPRNTINDAASGADMMNPTAARAGLAGNEMMPAAARAGMAGGEMVNPAAGRAGLAGGEMMPAAAGMAGRAGMAGNEMIPAAVRAGMAGGEIMPTAARAGMAGGDIMPAAARAGMAGGEMMPAAARAGMAAGMAGDEMMSTAGRAGMAGGEMMPAAARAGMVAGMAGGEMMPTAGRAGMAAGMAGDQMDGSYSMIPGGGMRPGLSSAVMGDRQLNPATAQLQRQQQQQQWMQQQQLQQQQQMRMRMMQQKQYEQQQMQQQHAAGYGNRMGMSGGAGMEGRVLGGAGLMKPGDSSQQSSMMMQNQMMMQGQQPRSQGFNRDMMSSYSLQQQQQQQAMMMHDRSQMMEQSPQQQQMMQQQMQLQNMRMASNETLQMQQQQQAYAMQQQQQMIGNSAAMAGCPSRFPSAAGMRPNGLVPRAPFLLGQPRYNNQ